MIPNTELATTKRVASFYGVEVSLVHFTLAENRRELSSNGVEKIDYHEIKKDYLNSGGKRKSWSEFCWDNGISSNSNTHSKIVVLLFGFLLEDSPKAEEVRRLVMLNNDAVITPIKAEPIQKQHNDIVVPSGTVSNEIVVVQNNQAVTTSLQVAETFGKQHAHVLRDIESLKKDVSNFGEMFYEGEMPDSYGRPRKTFYINRDGFTLLAMGFTGKKALKFKLKYIEQFNLMENQLKSQVTVASYMIDDPIKRAEQWISEQKNKALLEETIEKQTEVITHKQDVIEGLTDNISLAEKRQILNKVVRSGCSNGQTGKFIMEILKGQAVGQLLYRFNFDLAYANNRNRLLVAFIEPVSVGNEVGESLHRLFDWSYRAVCGRLTA